MCTRQQCLDRLIMATPEIKKRFGVKKMSLFGSMARGDNNLQSDVDIFVEMPPKAYQILRLKDYLQSLLGMSVDIVRSHSNLDSYLIQEIQNDGITIFT